VPTEVFDPVTPARGPAGGGVGPAIVKKLVVAGSAGAAVVVGLLLLTPGVLLPSPPSGPDPGDVLGPPPTTAAPGNSTLPGAPTGAPGEPTGGSDPSSGTRPSGAAGPDEPGGSDPTQPPPVVDPTWGHWQVLWASDVACFTQAGALADGGFHVSYVTTSAYA